MEVGNTYDNLPILTTVLAIATAIIILLYRFLVSPYRILTRHGLNGPRPIPFAVNYMTIKKVGHNKFIEEQIKEFGPVFGYYVGACPKVAVADVELAKEIMVKEFECFRDRGLLGPPNLVPKALKISQGLVVATGETWRTGRQVLTPSFSGLKMKLMVPLLRRSSDVLKEKMSEFSESEKSVEVCRVYGSFVMETMIATAFGRYVNIQRGEADYLTVAANDIFRMVQEGSPHGADLLIAILSNFPWIEPLLLRVLQKSEIANRVKIMHKAATGLIQARFESKEPPKIKDLLQLMLDATKSCADKKLTIEDIAGFSIDFLLGGYTTTANTLSCTTYLLAMNPHVQEKLQADIDQFLEESHRAVQMNLSELFDGHTCELLSQEVSLYKAAQELKYLDMVIQESLRLYTPVPKIYRYCCKTVKVGGVTIPEGATVTLPLAVIHHMPQYWPEPYKFDPERFTAEAKTKRPPLAHMPFGRGKRSCIGMRFAQLGVKIALIEILREYTFVKGPETVAKLEQVHGIASTPKGGVYVRIEKRF